MNYAPLVLMAGVGQRVEGSVLSNTPQTAVFVQGNSHKLYNSTIRDAVQQCNDVRHFRCVSCSCAASLDISECSSICLRMQCGAYYFGRDWTYRGMEIDGCNFSLPGTMWDESWSFINAIYAGIL
eukprot:SAG31_NODE_4710_length_3018_cov_1.356629_1_plen_125_part_00